MLIDGYSSSLFSIEEDVGKTEQVIDNNGTVITYIKGGGDDTSNLGIGCSELNPTNCLVENTNKINSINNYNFNTKFSEFRVNNENDKNYFLKKKDINGKQDNKIDNKENQTNNIIMKKKTQIKSLIKNINIEDNKY